MIYKSGALRNYSGLVSSDKMVFRGTALLVFATLISASLAKVTLTTNGLAATVSNGNVEVVFKADATVSAVKVNGVNIVSTSQKTFYLDWNENGQGMKCLVKLPLLKALKML